MGGRAEGFPRRLGLSRVSGQSMGQLRVALSVLLLHEQKLDVKRGNVPHPETVHHFLAALL